MFFFLLHTSMTVLIFQVTLFPKNLFPRSRSFSLPLSTLFFQFCARLPGLVPKKFLFTPSLCLETPSFLLLGASLHSPPSPPLRSNSSLVSLSSSYAPPFLLATAGPSHRFWGTGSPSLGGKSEVCFLSPHSVSVSPPVTGCCLTFDHSN